MKIVRIFRKLNFNNPIKNVLFFQRAESMLTKAREGEKLKTSEIEIVQSQLDHHKNEISQLSSELERTRTEKVQLEKEMTAKAGYELEGLKSQLEAEKIAIEKDLSAKLLKLENELSEARKYSDRLKAENDQISSKLTQLHGSTDILMKEKEARQYNNYKEDLKFT